MQIFYFKFQLMYVCSKWQSMIELSRTQDEEVGDGTTSVIILGMLLLMLASLLQIFGT